MDRTLVLDLNPTPEQLAAQLTTIVEYTACFNAVAAVGYISGCFNGVELHKRTYYPLRAEYPMLPAQLVVSSRMKATEAVKSALKHKRKGRKSAVPHAQLCPIRYDMRSYWVKWETGLCSLASVAGRIELRNIAAKYILAQRGISALGGQPVKLLIVTGDHGPLVTSPRL